MILCSIPNKRSPLFFSLGYVFSTFLNFGQVSALCQSYKKKVLIKKQCISCVPRFQRLSQLLLYNRFLHYPVLSTPSHHNMYIMGGGNIIIGIVYRAPDDRKNIYEVIDKITMTNSMNYQTNNFTGEFLDSMYSNLLRPFINRSSRINFN